MTILRSALNPRLHLELSYRPVPQEQPTDDREETAEYPVITSARQGEYEDTRRRSRV